MSCDKESLKLIQETACQAQAVEMVTMPEGDGRTAFVREGESLKRIAIPPAPRRHVVHSLEDLIAYARAANREEGCKPVVWHGPRRVQLILDDDDRRDWVSFPLEASTPFQALLKLEAERMPFDQREFLWFLRLDVGFNDLAVLEKFRRFDWRLGEAGLPDVLRISVPVYRQRHRGENDWYDVRCAVEIDTVNRKFLCVPLPGELDRVLDRAQADIRSRLDEQLDAELDGAEEPRRVPVFYGEFEGWKLALSRTICNRDAVCRADVR